MNLSIRLPESSIRVLDLFLSGGGKRGFELRRQASLSSSDFQKAIQPLLSAGMVAVSGSIDVDLLDTAEFAPLSRAYDSRNMVQPS
jgi:hypothetical protein